MARKPATASRATPVGLAGAARGRSGLTRATSSADERKTTAVSPNTILVLVTAKRMPPIAGPTKLARVAIVLAATFAAVSSSGVRASDGNAAACAGRNAVDESVTTPARM